ncbi:hypothetical protein [Lewinella sp. W8]|uniref:hypothetical protein n=1 Tax=Lewinella sp. W8 TaxID=2528208 RepID=UPI0010683215|nr:hypothetical protein [Lewinella sp. W8]MTB52090.1 hypothetical protein [Lewinella sp. W8]
MKHLVLLPIAFLLTATSLLAQLRGHVNYETLGVSFDIPPGWFGQEGEDMVILGSNTVPGLVILTTHSSSREELIQEARAGIADQNGTNMQLGGELKMLGDHAVGGMFTGTMEHQAAKGYIIGMANPQEGGIGVTIISASTQEAFSQANIEVADQLYQSFTFKKIDKRKEIDEWTEWLSNVRLTYMDSYYSPNATDGGISGGYSREQRIDLCGAGYFKQSGRDDMTITGDGVSGYSSGNQAGQGTWKIMAAGTQLMLVLKYHNGEEASYGLEYKDEKLYLDGTRYFRTRNGEYAPDCP